jgi:hypothetical protein
MPPKRSNRTLWIVLGSVGGALLLLCVVCSVLAVALGGQIGKQLGPVFGASTTLVNFCTAMQEQDYATAYAQFSTDLQGRVTEDEFTSNATKLDADQGRVTNCSTSSNTQRGYHALWRRDQRRDHQHHFRIIYLHQSGKQLQDRRDGVDL